MYIISVYIYYVFVYLFIERDRYTRRQRDRETKRERERERERDRDRQREGEGTIRIDQRKPLGDSTYRITYLWVVRATTTIMECALRFGIDALVDWLLGTFQGKGFMHPYWFTLGVTTNPRGPT